MSTTERSLLVSQIEKLFLNNNNREFYSFGQEELNEMKEAVLHGTYVLSPRKLVVLKKGEDDHLISKFPCVFEFSESSDYYFAFYVEPEDELLLMALNGVINHTFHNSSVFSERSFACRKDRNKKYFCETVVGWGKVELLLLFDLSSSLAILSHSAFVEKQKSVLKDPFLLRLVSSFFEWPVIDKTGTDWSSKEGIPTVPYLPPLLFNFFLDNFDRAFEENFPNFPHARYAYEVFVPIFMGTSKDFDVSKFMDLLRELGFVGKLMCIVPGGSPIECFGGFVFVNREGDIQILEKDF